MLRELLQERFLPRHQELRVLLEDCALDKFLYGHCEFVDMLRVSYVDGIRMNGFNGHRNGGLTLIVNLL